MSDLVNHSMFIEEALLLITLFSGDPAGYCLIYRGLY